MKADCVKLCDAYCVLGNLRFTSGEGVLHYIVLVTGCVSAGKLASSEVSLPLDRLDIDQSCPGVQDY